MSSASILLVTFIVTFTAFFSLWLISLRLKDCGIVDLYWGPGFAIIALVSASLTGPNLASSLLVACITLWGLRLFWHLWSRHKIAEAEDPRYKAMRLHHGENFAKVSLFTVFGLQAIIQWLLAFPLHAGLLAATGQPLGIWSALGVSLFLIGFTIEAIADYRLLVFKRNPANKGKLLTGGLFAWSRHPNYFGESVLWFGLAFMAYDLCGWLSVFLAPVTLTALLMNVSGLPLLEAHLRATRPEYEAYALRTSAFIPWPPKC